jgi:hypothetical protein
VLCKVRDEDAAVTSFKCIGSAESALAYSEQWNNPRPDVTIKSIDVTYGADKRGIPVLLAITAATTAK